MYLKINQLLKFNTLVSMVLMAFYLSCNGQKNTDLLDPPRFQIKLNSTPEAQLVDVRTPGEFAGGHLKKSKNIDYNSDDFENNLSVLIKEKPVFVYCKVGGRSAEAAKIMRKMGFAKVYELDGGILRWNNENMPMEGDKSEANNSFKKADLDKMVAGNEPVLVDFYAPWCGPCKKMEPTLAKLKTDWTGKAKVERINIDQAVDLAKSLKIDALPVLAVYVGGRELKRVSGFKSEQDIRKLMAEYIP